MTELSIRGGGETQNITKAEPHGRCTAKKKTWNGKENKHQTKEIGGGDERGISPLFTQNQAVFLVLFLPLEKLFYCYHCLTNLNYFLLILQ